MQGSFGEVNQRDIECSVDYELKAEFVCVSAYEFTLKRTSLNIELGFSLQALSLSLNVFRDFVWYTIV